MSTQEILREIPDTLPPDATLGDAISERALPRAVEQGLAGLDRGEGVPIEPVKAKVAPWRHVRRGRGQAPPVSTAAACLVQRG